MSRPVGSLVLDQEVAQLRTCYATLSKKGERLPSSACDAEERAWADAGRSEQDVGGVAWTGQLAWGTGLKESEALLQPRAKG